MPLIRNEYFLKDHFDALNRRDFDLFDRIVQRDPALAGAGPYPGVMRMLRLVRTMMAAFRRGPARRHDAASLPSSEHIIQD